MRLSKPRGFTLLEVLVAATIMFTVLSLSALAVKTYRASSAKAERRIHLLSYINLVTPQIQTKLKQSSDDSVATGTGQFGDLSYQWQAEVIAHKAAPRQMNPDTGQFEVTPKRFKLYQVQLQLTSQGLTIEKSYSEVVW